VPKYEHKSYHLRIVFVGNLRLLIGVQNKLDVFMHLSPFKKSLNMHRRLTGLLRGAGNIEGGFLFLIPPISGTIGKISALRAIYVSANSVSRTSIASGRLTTYNEQDYER